MDTQQNADNQVTNSNFTYFAPAERDDINKVKNQVDTLLKSPDFLALINSIPIIFMILNSSRQIVFGNERLANFLKIPSDQVPIGMRPGEIFNCIHSHENKGGCGTSEACEMCGAVNAIVDGLKGITCANECRILIGDGTEALDLKVYASPYRINDEDYVIFSIEDTSSEKRRAVLERTFLHDIINTAGGLKGITQLLKESPEDFDEFKDIIFELSTTLIDEINAQRQLLAAENDDLAVNLSEVNSIHLINSVIDTYKNHSVAENKQITLHSEVNIVNFLTDEPLAKRVVGNMTKNALEASDNGQTVTINCKDTPDYIEILVHNETVMPREVKLQMFQRSFSTKGSGRGIGTYSMKLLMEKYLKGKISFTSEEGEGTTFTASFLKNN